MDTRPKRFYGKEGVPLASSRYSRNNPDLIDLTVVIDAFQTINGVVITINGRVENVAGNPCLTFLLQAHDKNYEIGEVASLASVRCVPGSSQHLTVESAIMWSLYQLDAQLAVEELRKTKGG